MTMKRQTQSAKSQEPASLARRTASSAKDLRQDLNEGPSRWPAVRSSTQVHRRPSKRISSSIIIWSSR